VHGARLGTFSQFTCSPAAALAPTAAVCCLTARRLERLTGAGDEELGSAAARRFPRATSGWSFGSAAAVAAAAAAAAMAAAFCPRVERLPPEGDRAAAVAAPGTPPNDGTPLPSGRPRVKAAADAVPADALGPGTLALDAAAVVFSAAPPRPLGPEPPVVLFVVILTAWVPPLGLGVRRTPLPLSFSALALRAGLAGWATRRGCSGGRRADDAAGVTMLVSPGGKQVLPDDDAECLFTGGRADEAERCVLAISLVAATGGDPSAEERPPVGAHAAPEHAVLEGVDSGAASEDKRPADALLGSDGDVELAAPSGVADVLVLGVPGCTTPSLSTSCTGRAPTTAGAAAKMVAAAAPFCAAAAEGGGASNGEDPADDADGTGEVAGADGGRGLAAERGARCTTADDAGARDGGAVDAGGDGAGAVDTGTGGIGVSEAGVGRVGNFEEVAGGVGAVSAGDGRVRATDAGTVVVGPL